MPNTSSDHLTSRGSVSALSHAALPVLPATREAHTVRVLNMQGESTGGWMVRAKEHGLRVGVRSGRFGDEHMVIKSATAVVHLTQNLNNGRNLRIDGFTDDQKNIVSALQQCGLIAVACRRQSRAGQGRAR